MTGFKQKLLLPVSFENMTKPVYQIQQTHLSPSNWKPFFASMPDASLICTPLNMEVNKLYKRTNYTYLSKDEIVKLRI